MHHQDKNPGLALPHPKFLTFLAKGIVSLWFLPTTIGFLKFVIWIVAINVMVKYKVLKKKQKTG